LFSQHAERHVAQEGGFAGARRGDDEAAGAFADGTEKIDGARREPAVLQLHLQKLIGRDGGERGEVEALRDDPRGARRRRSR
jgi:hypothetical protein